MTSDSKVFEISTEHGSLKFGERCLVMGILNVTPDSFSDGGKFHNPDAAIERAFVIATEGADLIDIGGESTRPGALPVEPEEQIRRIVPVIREARRRGLSLPISVDTRSARVAAESLAAGADMVNDISGALDDPHMPELLRTSGVPFVIMHMRGRPATMQDDPQYDNVVENIRDFFHRRARDLADAGIDTARMIVDPGIGFGKTIEHNLEILRHLCELGGRWPVLVGASRKKFIGTLLGLDEPGERLVGSLAVVAYSALAGVEMLRVHDVRQTRQVVELCRHLRGTSSTAPRLYS